MFVKNNTENNRFKKPWDDKKNSLRCDHCGLKGHTKESCFKLVGYPNRFKNKFQSQKQRYQNSRGAAAYMAETPLDHESNSQLEGLWQSVEKIQSQLGKMMHPGQDETNEMVNFAASEEFAGMSTSLMKEHMSEVTG